MEKIGIFLADGFEEIEALASVDILRRAGEEAEMISVSGRQMVEGSHGIGVRADRMLADVDFSELKMILLPGGGQGTVHLEACEPLMEKLDEFYKNGKLVAAICAAPSIFGHRGYLKGRRATCYPGFEAQLDGAEVTEGPAERDGNVITGRGMGRSIEFALKVLEALQGEEAVRDMADKICFEIGQPGEDRR